MDAIGMLEFNSIPAGINAGDAMAKAADVEIIQAQAVCAGKYFVLVKGDVAAVKSALEAGKETGETYLVDDMEIANVHPQVFSAINCCSEVSQLNALGIIETFSLASAVFCADVAAKAADIQLIEIRLGRGLGGRSFVLLTGDVAAAEHAVQAAREEYVDKGMMANTVVIPSPHPQITKYVI